MSEEPKETKLQGYSENLSYTHLVTTPFYHNVRRKLRAAATMSISGITNFIVDYEDPSLVNAFLDYCFKRTDLFNETHLIDVTQIEDPVPQIKNLIFGEPVTEDELSIDTRTLSRNRKPNGFVTRKELMRGEISDRHLVIRNLDLDSSNYLEYFKMFNIFRDPSVKMGCRIVLVCNSDISFPFEVFRVTLPFIDESVASSIVESFVQLYSQARFKVIITDDDRTNLIKIISGRKNYCLASNDISRACSGYILSQPEKTKTIDFTEISNNFRKYNTVIS